MNKITIITAGIALLLGSCGNSEKAYDATGTFEATEVTVSAKATGELVSFDVTEGKTLNADQQVGSIDAKKLILQSQQLETTSDGLSADRAALEANRAATDSKILDSERQIAVIRQQISNAKRERQRFEELVRDGAAPRKQVDDIDQQIRVLERQLAATREQLRSANESLRQQSRGLEAQKKSIDAKRAGIGVQREQVNENINDTRITAPIRGTVLEKYAERGEFVNIGKPLFKIADVERMYLRAYVTSGQLASVKVGQEVTVFADFGKDNRKAYKGTVSWISDRSEFTPKTILTDDERADLVYAVKILVKNDGVIKIGMYGEVKF